MENTCLYHFYEYIFNNWIHGQLTLPDFESEFHDNKSDAGGLEIRELERRKKYIWENTRCVLEEFSRGRQNKLQEVLAQPGECHLCFVCRKCETEYWQELKDYLFHDENEYTLTKSDFLIPEEVKDLLKQKERPVDVYLDYYRRNIMHERNIIVMLKGFSSSTPILLNYARNTNFYSGGGFYIRWNGVGIAVDPGYLFVQNLHDYGLSILDIDVVVITHEHIDHSSDMRIIDDLHYNVASHCSEKMIEWDEEQFLISRRRNKRHEIKWYMDSVTCEEAILLSMKESGFNNKFNRLFCINTADEDDSVLRDRFHGHAEIISTRNIEISQGIRMHVFRTAHEQYKKGDDKEYFLHTYGCAFECGQSDDEKRWIGYTSDTSVQEEFYSDMQEVLARCHIIIANISGIYQKDILFRRLKERHLGYYGCYKILYDIVTKKDYALKCFLLSEFSNQVSDIRFGVSKYLQEEINDLVKKNGEPAIRVLPTEIALTMDIHEFQTRCTICGKYSDQVHILRPHGENNKLQYICPECIYTSI